MDMDKETYDRVLQRLIKLKAAELRKQIQREIKLWDDIEPPFRLADLLARLTREELNRIRQNLGIKKISNLKKQELIARLPDLIRARAEEAFRLFDHDRYSLAKRIVDSGGYTFRHQLETEQVEYLRTRGIIFSGIIEGRKALVMPEEIAWEFQKADKAGLAGIARRNTRWVRLTQGLLYYYGTLDLQQLEEMVEKYTGEKVETRDYLRVLFDAVDYYREVRPDGGFFSNIRVWDANRVREEHQARPDVDFYPFTRDKLLKAGKPGFVDRNFAYLEFVDFISENYEISRDEADSIVEECVYAIRIGEPIGDIMNYLQGHLEIDSFEMAGAFARQLSRLHNNTRQWFLKGFTPEELFEREKKFLQPLPGKGPEVIDFRTRQRIGRNDPCPCGSGIKFKKCCGR